MDYIHQLKEIIRMDFKTQPNYICCLQNPILNIKTHKDKKQMDAEKCIILKLECQSLSCVRLFAIPWTVAHKASYPWNSPGKSTRVGSHSLLQGILPTQGSNSCLLHCRQILYHLSHKGSPLTLSPQPHTHKKNRSNYVNFRQSRFQCNETYQDKKGYIHT